ncbi:MAG: hypothetical protein HUU18_00745 [Phycisphaerales bacterium]|nr:hypothetical protein [Phycisphaerales bacterium]NUQ66796.1 hypothetical protein [Phycisphaerales bacterium]
MFISDMANSGSRPVLEQMLRFAGERQRILAHNIANMSTPEFQAADVSVRGFQDQLAAAVDARRAQTGGAHGDLVLKDTSEVRQVGDSLEITPQTSNGEVQFQDRNNRDYVRLMQDLAENNLVFRTAADLLRWHQGMIRAAITQRP